MTRSLVPGYTLGMRFEAEIEIGGFAAREAREVIRERIADTVPAVTLADVLTIVTELVRNAVSFGQGDHIWVRLDASNGRLHGEVENFGNAAVEPRELDPHRLRGLGLHIVDAIADEWNVEQGEGTTRLRFELKRP